MTLEKQNIDEDFYSGNHKDIQVDIVDHLGEKKDLTSAELTYILMTDKYVEVLRKSSIDDGIEVTVPPTDGICIIHLIGADTYNLYGTYRHHLNVVDANGYEETVMTGSVDIIRTLARRVRKGTHTAYLQGT
jgi:hypothetical protein